MKQILRTGGGGGLPPEVVAAALREMAKDDASNLQGHATFYVTEKIGDKRAMTPEGFLLCMDVPIARTGEMLYGPGETPLLVGDAGYLIIERSEAEVFRPEFVASFEGKPVTNDHPREGVNPANWKRYAVGTTINPRRGEAEHANFIVADLLITDAEAIQDILEGKREVSAGYEAEYTQIRPGRGRQHDMIANHVALVAAGRCGSRCSIGDQKTTPQGEPDMLTKDNASVTLDAGARIKAWWDGVATKVRAAFAAKDQAALDALLNAAPTADSLGVPAGENAVHIHAGGRDEEAHAEIAQLRTRLAAFDELLPHVGKLKALATDESEEESEEEKKKREAKEATDAALAADLVAEAPAGTAEKAKLAKDSEFMADSHQEAASGAEILVPGMSITAFDRAAAPQVTLDVVCRMRRNALDLAYSTPEGRSLVEGLLGGKRLELDKMACADVRTLFRSAVAAKKVATKAVQQTRRPAADVKVVPPIRSIADLNKRNAERYAPK